ncbi:hypothetical protein CC79DRAFT_1366925 [Sarocladium strictum]
MAQHPNEPAKQGILRRIFGRHNSSDHTALDSKINDLETELDPEREANAESEPENVRQAGEPELPSEDPSTRPVSSRRASYNVVPGLPRAQTFKRQQSEKRTHLEPVQPTPDERRALSVDRRSIGRQHSPISRLLHENPRVSAPGILSPEPSILNKPLSFADRSQSRVRRRDDSESHFEALAHASDGHNPDLHDTNCHNVPSMTDTHSVTDSGYEDDDIIARELDTKWILNLSMHFRDRSKREKFFVTYRQEHAWRRVTISLDYRNAPPDSLESQLDRTRYQRDKIAKIYEAIRESLDDIQFYDTVTNLKLQTSDGRLYVHVMEDGNEIIRYPPVREIRHLHCRQVPESEIVFDSHMSGFVYKVLVGDKLLIKKEIPSPETVDEFLYEINALNDLSDSPNVIDFYGVVVDDQSQLVKGLLIDYADKGTLIDLLYEHREHNIPLSWETREKWARQIVQGLADVHESGFVQGDFTLSNIVITKDDDARIIDINRRGCPVGWEPPEAAPLIESGHRIAMYIGVKSDLYQLGMVLWAIAVLEDEPETRGRPLLLEAEDNVPEWYREVTETCLSDDPRSRLQAVVLLDKYPPLRERSDPITRPRFLHTELTIRPAQAARSPSEERRSGLVAQPSSEWSHVSRTFTASATRDYSSSYYPPRGRSPPSRQPSTPGDYKSQLRMSHRTAAWCDDVESVARSHYSNEDIDQEHVTIQDDTPASPLDGERLLAMDGSAQTLKAEMRADDVHHAHDRTWTLHDDLPLTPDDQGSADVPKLLVNEPSPIDQNIEGGASAVDRSAELMESVASDTTNTLSEVNLPGEPETELPLSQKYSVADLVKTPSQTYAASSSLETMTPQGASKVMDNTASSIGEGSLQIAEPRDMEDHESLERKDSPESSAVAKPLGQTPTPDGPDTLGDSAGSQQPQAPGGQGTPDSMPAEMQGTLIDKLNNAHNGLMDQTHSSSSAPISRRVTDEGFPSLPRGRPSSDGAAASPAAQAPRSCHPGPPATMSLTDMSNCLVGIGGGLGDAMTEGGSFDDDFSILGRPPQLMISTDSNNR